MAPNKFDKHIKEILEARQMEPSSHAWNKLSQRLDNQQPNRNKSVFWLVGIAASVVGVLLVNMFFFSENTTNDKEIPIVESKTDAKIEQNQSLKESENSSVANIQKQILSTESYDVNTTEEKEDIEESVKLNSKENLVSNENVVSNSETTNEEKPMNEKTFPHSETDFELYEAQKIKEVVSEITKFKAEKDKVTDQEIDSLLKQAERELFKNKILLENSKTVSADALLQEVEDELEKTFRDKVFDALKKSFESVKTVVADRNN